MTANDYLDSETDARPAASDFLDSPLSAEDFLDAPESQTQVAPRPLGTDEDRKRWAESEAQGDAAFQRSHDPARVAADYQASMKAYEVPGLFDPSFTLPYVTAKTAADFTTPPRQQLGEPEERYQTRLESWEQQRKLVVDHPTWSALPAATYNVAKGLPEFLSSPGALMTLGVGEGFPLAGRLISLGFAGEILRQTKEVATQAGLEWDHMSRQEQVQFFIQMMANAAFVKRLGEHGLNGTGGAPKEQPTERETVDLSSLDPAKLKAEIEGNTFKPKTTNEAVPAQTPAPDSATEAVLSANPEAAPSDPVPEAPGPTDGLAPDGTERAATRNAPDVRQEPNGQASIPADQTAVSPTFLQQLLSAPLRRAPEPEPVPTDLAPLGKPPRTIQEELGSYGNDGGGSPGSTRSPSEVLSTDLLDAVVDRSNDSEPEVGLVAGSKLEKWADATIKEGQSRMNTGLDPQLMTAYAVKGAALLERGIRGTSEWAFEMVKEFGPEVRPYLAAIRQASDTTFQKALDQWVGKPLRSIGPAFPADAEMPDLLPVRKLSNDDIAREAAGVFTKWDPKITAADGSEILLKNPEQGSTGARVRHLIFDNASNQLHLGKAEWLPMVPETLRNAAVRIADPDTGNRIYVRAYGDGTKHMVVVSPEGEVIGSTPFRGKLITQFLYEKMSRRGDFLVDWVRRGEEGTGQSQGNPSPTPTGSTGPDPRQSEFQGQGSPSSENVNEDKIGEAAANRGSIGAYSAAAPDGPDVRQELSGQTSVPAGEGTLRPTILERLLGLDRADESDQKSRAAYRGTESSATSPQDPRTIQEILSSDTAAADQRISGADQEGISRHNKLEPDLRPVFSLEENPKYGEIRPDESPKAETQAAIASLRTWLDKLYRGAQGIVPAEVPWVGAQRDPLPRETRAARDAFSAFERVFGRQIIFFDGDVPVNGAVIPSRPRILFLKYPSERTPMVAVGHELLESIRVQRPGLFKALRDDLLPVMTRIDEYRTRLNTLEQRRDGILSPSSREDAIKEIIADFTGDCLSNTKFLKQLSETAPTTFSRFTDAMMSFLQYVINSLKPYGSNRYFTDIQMARDRLAQFLADHARAEARGRGPE